MSEIIGSCQIVSVDFGVSIPNADVWRDSIAMLCLSLSDGRRIFFSGLTDCCANVSLRTSGKELMTLVGTQVSNIRVFTTETDDDGYGEYSTIYNYIVSFEDGTEFCFDFEGYHGNGGYYMAEVCVEICEPIEVVD
jgi:hypothetical protein